MICIVLTMKLKTRLVISHQTKVIGSNSSSPINRLRIFITLQKIYLHQFVNIQQKSRKAGKQLHSICLIKFRRSIWSDFLILSFIFTNVLWFLRNTTFLIYKHDLDASFQILLWQLLVFFRGILLRYSPGNSKVYYCWDRSSDFRSSFRDKIQWNYEYKTTIARAEWRFKTQSKN